MNCELNKSRINFRQLLATNKPKTSKTTFNNDQPRSEKEKDLWLETL